ncbi:recombination regulator RecX [Georgenia sp. TF02-10]|uniref:regulatory protein RecX n=1 Tax=Georgenia sp. TF02-10 TaxID=2917725 RepID=UPI001FA71B92|nr:regulatory protein RecX [Georgenia sp. TF02-10]UNX55942.1 recombination regulator RecX [Georgenia sp. TF02-10]
MAGPRGGRRRLPAPEPPADGAAAHDAEPDAEQVARTIALRQLTAAPRSRAQLAEAMARRDVPADVATRVLDRFTEVGLVDDAAYAEMLVRTRHAERGLARRALAEELRRRGIDPEVAEGALAQVGEDDELAAARRLAEKKARATRGLDVQVRRRRLAGALGRKGFGAGVAMRVVEEVLAAEAADADDSAADPAG